MPRLDGEQCAPECDAGEARRSLACGCAGGGCDMDLDGFLRDSACRLDAEVVAFPCGDTTSTLVRVISERDLFVFAFERGRLIGFQQDEAEANACGGGTSFFGRHLVCPSEGSDDDGGIPFESPSHDPCKAP